MIPSGALVQLAAAVLLLGASWPITRVALLHGAGPAWFALGRAGVSAGIVTISLAALGRLRWPGRRDLPSLLAIGLLQLAGFFAFAHEAVAWVPAGRVAVLANCTIVFTVPLSLLFLRETIPPRRWLAAALGAAGVVAMVGPWAFEWSAPHILVGHVLLLGSALCWAVSMLVVRRHPPAMPMLQLLPWAFIVATTALAPMALTHAVGEWDATAGWSLLAIGLIVAPLGTWCVIEAQVRLPIVVASVGFLAGPVVGVMLATVFLHERLGPDMLIGAALILSGAGLAGTRGRVR